MEITKKQWEVLKRYCKDREEGRTGVYSFCRELERIHEKMRICDFFGCPLKKELEAKK